MAEPTPETEHYGLTRVGRGETLAKNGYAALDLDRIALDQLLWALTNHSHAGGDRLGGPTSGPVLTPENSGGTLPADTTFYYRFAWCDQFGLETAASPEVAVTTPAGIPNPTAAAGTAETTGGTLAAGLYSYVISFATADGGETVASAQTNVRLAEGTINRVRLDLPNLPAGAVAIRIYRARPGQGRYFYLNETTDTFYYDDGTILEDQTMVSPAENTTNSLNAITVAVPGGVIPEGAFSWKIYRSVEPGVYDGFNLVHHVVEGSSETSPDLRTFWKDTGDILEQGEPRFVDMTFGGGVQVASGDVTAPRGSRVWSTAIPGTLVEREYNRTNIPEILRPTRLTAFFPEPPSIAAGESIRIRVADSQATPDYIELVWGETESGLEYLEKTWPIRDNDYAEAESGTRSAASPIESDTTAANGQRIHLPGDGDFVHIDWGVLEVGVFRTFVKVKYTTVQPATPATLLFETIRVDDGVVVGSTLITPVAEDINGWVEYEGQQFSAPGDVAIRTRVTKNDAIAVPFYVDSFRYEAIVPELVPGLVSVEVVHDNPQATPVPGADAQVSVWF